MNDKNFSGYFDKLTNDNREVKISTAEKLIASVETSSRNEVKTADGKIGDKSLNFGENVGKDLLYTLKRLVNGSNSMLVDNQVSFAFPLVSLLQKFQEIEPAQFFESILSICDPKKTVKKSEISHFILGKQLCLLALITAGKVDLKNKNLLGRIVDEIVKDMTNQPWAREGSATLLVKIVETAGKNPQSALEVLSAKLKPMLKASAKPDAGLLKFVVQLESACKKTKVENPWTFHLDNFMNNMDELLQTLFIETADNFPQKHTVIKDFIKYLSAHKKTPKWKTFWSKVAEFIAAEGRTYKNFYLVLYAVKRALKEFGGSVSSIAGVLEVLQDSILNLWLRNLKSMNKNSRDLAGKIETLFTKLVEETVSKNPHDHSPECLALLIALKTSPHFTVIPKSNLCKTLIKSLAPVDQESFISFLKDKITGQTSPNAYKFFLGELASLSTMFVDSIDENSLLEIGYFLLKQSLEPDFDFEAYNQGLEQQKKELLFDNDVSDISSKKIKDQIKELSFGKLQSLLSMLNKRSAPFAQAAKKSSEMYKGLCADKHHFAEKLLKKWISLLKDSEEQQAYREVLFHLDLHNFTVALI